MAELSCILNICLGAFVGSASALPVLAASGGVAAFSLYAAARSGSIRSRIRWSYPLVFSVLFAVTYFALTMMCHESTPLCADHALLYSIPAAIIGSLLFGYVVLPRICLAWSRGRLSKSLAKHLPKSVPVFVADSGRPYAFSYGGIGRWIVVSQGMVDVLAKNELRAVLLHEYGHLEGNASLYKASRWVYSAMPLLHAFLDGRALDDEEETQADDFAIRAQGTARHLNSAKAKLADYFGC